MARKKICCPKGARRVKIGKKIGCKKGKKRVARLKSCKR